MSHVDSLSEDEGKKNNIFSWHKKIKALLKKFSSFFGVKNKEIRSIKNTLNLTRKERAIKNQRGGRRYCHCA